MSKILNLDENEADQLADFLGHDIRIHRQYYRLPEETLQLAKISKVLMAMEKGTLSDYKGKKLDDIEIDPNGMSILGLSLCIFAAHIFKTIYIIMSQMVTISNIVLMFLSMNYLEQLEAQGDSMSSDEEDYTDLSQTTAATETDQPVQSNKSVSQVDQGKKNLQTTQTTIIK